VSAGVAFGEWCEGMLRYDVIQFQFMRRFGTQRDMRIRRPEN
jgi:hypothetical protein